MNSSRLLDVRDLSIRFSSYSNRTQVVTEASVSVESGEISGLVGETGAGKSMFALGILRLLPGIAEVVGGSVRFNGRDLLSAGNDELRSIRGDALGFIPSNPRTSLDPVVRIGDTLTAAIMAHRPQPKNEAAGLATEMLDRVGIPDAARRMRSYPFELSGGMAQRAAIAVAIINSPQLLVADEPTSGLDVTVQAQVLELLAELASEQGAGMFMITRDLAIVAHYCESVSVMYGGWIVERSPVREFFRAPLHPYSTAILSAVSLKERRRSLFSLAGSMPRTDGNLTRCVAIERCSLVEPVCHESMPPPVEVEPGRTVRCHVIARGAPPSAERESAVEVARDHAR